ncbi:DUF317 domain-containing protein [Streptomyces sp. NPDC053493]|uniref:DUF317 domain-containing protein n=1 Tax=Streptomyces sp. NPDC053493 TaxID=3365705 RepID=UPI0037D38FB2
MSPNGLCGAEWTRAAYSFQLGDPPVAWQVSARSHSGSGLPEWNAYFTAGVPPRDADRLPSRPRRPHGTRLLLRKPRDRPRGGLCPRMGTRH